MSLTIDQILAEVRGEIESPLTYNTVEKNASAQPSTSNKTHVVSDEVEKMAGLLREAILPEETVTTKIVTQDISMGEKIAEALILSQTLGVLSVEDTEATKVASFREEALRAGYDSKEVDAFLEKQAKMSMWGSLKKSPLAKIVGATAALGASAAAGHEVGESRTEDKARAAIKNTGDQAFKAGLRAGYGVGVKKGLTAGTEYYKKKLQEMRQGKV